MEIVLFVFNIIITIASSLAIACSYYLYRKADKPIFIFVGVFFATYILDNLIIFMTDFIERFSYTYTNIFTSSPIFKTLIYFIYIFCYYNVYTFILSKKISTSGYLILITYAVFLMVEPVFFTGKWSALLFYHCTQILNICLILNILYKFRHSSDEYILMYPKYIKLLQLSLVFNVLIMIEDSYVILRIDKYTSFNITINYRSFTENIMFLIYALLFLRFTSQFFNNALKKESPISFGYTNDNGKISASKNTDSYKKSSNLFCDEYGFTDREKEVFIELIESNRTQEIADHLFISIGTVKTHIHNIYQKVDVTKRNMLIYKYHDFMDIKDNKKCVLIRNKEV